MKEDRLEEITQEVEKLIQQIEQFKKNFK